MKILYALQGTGNGHLSRARDIVAHLKLENEVDILISGTQVEVDLPYVIKYRYKGLGFVFGKKGGIDYAATFRSNSLKKLFAEIKSLPIEEYDLILNDFEPISAWACKLSGKFCVGLSHQLAILNKKAPKPAKKDLLGKLVLKNYAPAKVYFGFHFSSYDNNIYTPVIRNQIRMATPVKKPHYTVYLPAYSDNRILKILSYFENIQWEVFSKHTGENYSLGNVKVRKIDNDSFVESLISCTGVLCGAGFETPAEALFLNKKLMVVPMKGQYEQQCNAAALKDMEVPVLKKFNAKRIPEIKKWIETDQEITVDYPEQTALILQKILRLTLEIGDTKNLKDYSYKSFKKKIEKTKFGALK
ncbi:MAG: glycosyl transferase [Flavobacteriales bacterium]|nr:glycosyl transferase [Flavobacteriales bacterium]